MRWVQTLVTVSPALAALTLGWCAWDFVEAFATYAPRWLIGVALLSLLPVVIQLLLWGLSAGRRVPHPFGVVLLLGLVLMLPLWSTGERVASWFPSLCKVSTYDEIKPRRPGKSGPTTTFSAGASGWGNPRSFEFTAVTFIYTVPPSERRKDDLYVLLPRWEGFYINSYTTHFPVTRDRVLEYVRGSDEFPPGEAEALADRLWDLLLRYAERRDIPAVVYRGFDEPPPRVVYWVPGAGIYLVTSLLCVPILLALSWLLASWHCRAVRGQHASGAAEPCVGFRREGPA